MLKLSATAPFAIFALLTIIAGCAEHPPIFGENNAVNTPLYADNRVYFLEPSAPHMFNQKLTGLGEPLSVANPEVRPVPRNSPLSIIMRSVDFPASSESSNGSKSAISGPADYAVILDVGAAADGTTKSIVVWYQRGVQPDQSLNFSNLLIYYEPQWDERIAPFFRIRVMDVTKERNEQTRKSLERANNVAGGIGSLAANPAIAPLVGVAFTAAELVFANNENKLIIDYSVQLYSQVAIGNSGGSDLGLLRSGSYLVMGRPTGLNRSFWESTDMYYQTRSRRIMSNNTLINVPTALITVGTFKSIVPTSVMQRSTALTALLATSGTGASAEQLDEAARRLAISVKALALSEKLGKYHSGKYAEDIVRTLINPEDSENLGADNTYSLLQALNECYKRPTPFIDGADAKKYITSIADNSCVEDK